MKIGIAVGKLIILVFWVMVVMNLVSPFPGMLALVFGWGGVFILLIHLCELIGWRKQLKQYSKRPWLDGMLIVLFGAFQLFPLLTARQQMRQ